MARTFGLKIPGKRPSVTIVDFSVTLPVLGDTFDVSYAPLLRTGSQVSGGGKIFETNNDIDSTNHPGPNTHKKWANIVDQIITNKLLKESQI
jgi:hypothetical protein